MDGAESRICVLLAAPAITRGFKNRYDFLFYTGYRIKFELLIGTIFEEIIVSFDIIGFIENDNDITFIDLYKNYCIDEFDFEGFKPHHINFLIEKMSNRGLYSANDILYENQLEL